MLFGRYRFHAALEDEASLPPYKGSTFRGVFGAALKSVVCALKRQDCPDCLLRSQCVYSLVFEAPERQGPSPPHPFVIEPPLSEATHFPPGEAFDFTLLLFGDANRYLPYFVYAFEAMGELGVGRKMQGRRARFRLEGVTDGGQALYDPQARTLAAAPAASLDLAPPLPQDGRACRLTVFLDTPLRLKHLNRLQAELPFHVLMRAALRRLAVLGRHFGQGEPRLDYRGLVARAQEVQTALSDLHWFDWQRYSNRQEQAMLLGGLVGQATYEGRLAEFLPLLRLAEQVHLGKATTFGLGKIKLMG
jgi:hypothetical protein